MANVHIADEIVLNILTRLPEKPLLRFRCVSTHWNCLISDLMKTRSRLMILNAYTGSLFVIDDNVPVNNKAHSEVRVPRFLLDRHPDVSIVGSFNGVVILAFTGKLVLYNPLTCVSKILLADTPCPGYNNPCVFGFVSTADDLKIVRFENFGFYYKCDVLDLKTNTWARPRKYIGQDFAFRSRDVGVFLNGFLYWRTKYSHQWILALNVKDMVLSKIKTPNEDVVFVIGSLDGRLCMVNRIEGNSFDVWMMNSDHGVERTWFKVRSFTLGPKGSCFNMFLPICVLGNGKIVFASGSDESRVLIYDTSNGSYKTLDGLAPLMNKLNRLKGGIFHEDNNDYSCKDLLCLEYVESLVSPSDCFS